MKRKIKKVRQDDGPNYLVVPFIVGVLTWILAGNFGLGITVFAATLAGNLLIEKKG